MIRLYNSLTRKKEEFVPSKKTVGLYNCGPTVYSYAHIGNLRTYVFEDVLRRTLEYSGHRVKQVMNVTDVGHLTSDADTGEDKLAAAASRERKTAWQIAKRYETAFKADLKRLNILTPTVMPRATEHIKQQIALIRALEKKGFTYRTSDGVYFDTAKFPGYGKLSGQDLSEKEAGKRVEQGEKRNPTDFALWKFSYPGGVSLAEFKKVALLPPLFLINQKGRRDPARGGTRGSGNVLAKRDMEWKSPWGIGFPGWHIECSAMSREYLGQPFDIHTGGIDHLPVHHENEIAQSEAAYGVPLARVWMHGEFLTMKDEKMSKSKGNVLTLQSLIDQGYDPLAYRYFTYSAHYRKPLTWSLEGLVAAQNALTNLRDVVRGWDKPKIGCTEFEARFKEAIEDDLDMPRAMAIVWELVKSDNPSSAKAESLLKFDQVLGLGLDKYVAKPLKLPVVVKKLLKLRETARAGKDWKESDRLRDLILKEGFSVEDTKDGQVVGGGTGK